MSSSSASFSIGIAWALLTVSKRAAMPAATRRPMSSGQPTIWLSTSSTSGKAYWVTRSACPVRQKVLIRVMAIFSTIG
ncbi:Uncharacterised protein [Mycobacteroides abscessus subsp. abscessus]|nr:Uncharacterised protein [Mycobacteroides abscessus subsp. abscessus]